jgi:N-6 DNA Methylase
MAEVPTATRFDRLRGHARKFGCPNLIWLGSEPDPAHLEYLDLLPTKSRAPVLPEAVAEFQDRPLLYLVDGLDEVGEPRLQARQIENLQCLLANRSEHACLGVVTPGSLDVYPLNLDRKALAAAKFRTFLVSEPGAGTFFQSLATGVLELPGRPKQPDYVFDAIHKLLKAASEDLVGKGGKGGPMRGLDVLSTTGRALFFRFLIDRGIVIPRELTQISPDSDDLRDVFSTPEKAAATSCWLDETFNGDLLPLVDGITEETSSIERLRRYRRFYRDAGQATEMHLFDHLQAILWGWEHVEGRSFQMTLDIDWNDFNFAHIPIGVLSQVYETFSHQWDEANAEETSVYYTPRSIAKLLVDEAFAGVKNAAEAAVLDPACGAGVFLVLAFRRLVREYWVTNGIRPDTRAIQRILYKQLRGFEVSESALRLSALSLYISAIEVNATQRPPKALKFPHPLRREVLLSFGQQDHDANRGFVLGSLGSNVPTSFDGTFDIVVTNPPWTRLRATSDDEKTKTEEKKRLTVINAEFTALTRRALIARGCRDLADNYSNPDYNPDLPFLWRATEWAKPEGLIAMALPARIILKQSKNGKAARNTILKGLAVAGILNASDLEETPVWPNMKLPFMLLFARNSVPKKDHHFHFVTPIRENRLSSRGVFRLDYKAAETVAASAVTEKPWLLKALAVGTVLDVEVVERLSFNALDKVWKNNNSYSGKGYDLFSGIESTEDLLELRDFELPKSGFDLRPRELQRWRERHDQKNINRARDKRLYEPPLVIVPETPRESRLDPKAFLSWDEAVSFSRSNYGYSAAASPNGKELVSTLYLAVHSLLFQYFCLMRSSRQGASYRTILKEDLDEFPFPDPSRLKKADKDRAISLAEALQTADTKPWDDIDDFVFRLYGLDDHDARVVRDTVEFCGPYQSVRQRAEEPVPPDEIRAFCLYLEDMLQPLFEIADQKVVVNTVPQSSTEWLPSWQFVSVTLAGDELQGMPRLIARLISHANKTGASRIVLGVPDGGLLIGILNARRFWTRSRARLCSLHIEQHHLDTFRLPMR